jgi:hypothetical protein
MFELAYATAERGLAKQQNFGRAPKAAVIRCCHSVSEMLQSTADVRIRLSFLLDLCSLTILATIDHSYH